MNDTAELLSAWVERGSEEAFAKLVARHIDLVYSVAVRKVAGDSGLAADIVQVVFADLARKARTLRAEGSLAGWLHRHTCYVAATAFRSELRRRIREQTAAAMHALEQSSDPVWPRLAPLLDDAVNALNETDRRAILLRFYEEHDLRNVGAALGVGDDAAQKRISRALEKLREWLARRGLKSTTAALATMLSTQGVVSAPAGLAATVTSSAITAAAAGSAGAVSFFELMTHFKAKLAVTAAAAAVVATPLVWQENAIAKARSENQSLATRAEPLEQLRAVQTRAALMPSAESDAAQADRDRAELDRLRAEAASIRDRLQTAREQVVAARSTLAAARRAVPGTISMLDAHDVGAGTGEALIQTFLWAARNADTNRIIQLADWSAPEAEGEMAKMAEELAQAAGEGKMEKELGDMTFRVVRQVPLENGDAALVLVGQKGEEDIENMAWRIRRFGNEWRLVIGKGGPQEVKLTEDQMRE